MAALRYEFVCACVLTCACVFTFELCTTMYLSFIYTNKGEVNGY